jgi:hypothetical protein
MTLELKNMTLCFKLNELCSYMCMLINVVCNSVGLL